MIVVFAFLVSLIPSLIFFLCIRRSFKDKPGYGNGCWMAVCHGFLSVLPITLAAFVLDLIGSVTGLKKAGWFVWGLYQSFFLFALTEELFKFLLFRRVLRKTECDCSWYDITVFMTLVGVGFGLLESVLYSFEMSPVSAIIRGVTLAHGGYGFIMGYFYGKGKKTGKKGYLVISFLLPYLLHAIYDFLLVPELSEYNEDIAGIAVILAFVDLVVFILAIVFFARRRKDPKYTESLGLKTA